MYTLFLSSDKVVKLVGRGEGLLSTGYTLSIKKKKIKKIFALLSAEHDPSRNSSDYMTPSLPSAVLPSRKSDQEIFKGEYCYVRL